MQTPPPSSLPFCNVADKGRVCLCVCVGGCHSSPLHGRVYYYLKNNNCFPAAKIWIPRGASEFPPPQIPPDSRSCRPWGAGEGGGVRCCCAVLDVTSLQPWRRKAGCGRRFPLFSGRRAGWLDKLAGLPLSLSLSLLQICKKNEIEERAPSIRGKGISPLPFLPRFASP